MSGQWPSQDVGMLRTQTPPEEDSSPLFGFETMRAALAGRLELDDATRVSLKIDGGKMFQEVGNSTTDSEVQQYTFMPLPFHEPVPSAPGTPTGMSFSSINGSGASYFEDQDGGLNGLDDGLDEGDAGAKVEVTRADPSAPYFSASTFEEIGLSEELLKGVYSLKFQKPSKIQAASLPLILSADGADRNLIAQAHNGSGKTACFALGMLSRVDTSQSCTQAVCLAPTRELARQIVDVVTAIGKFTSTTTQLVIKDTNEDRNRLRSIRGWGASRPASHIVVGTPGKIMDQLKRRTLDFSCVRVCVLDEADEMVRTQGMGDQTIRIKRAFPKDVQTLLFSATYEDNVRDLALRVAPDANHIWVKREMLSLDKVMQYFIDCVASETRFEVLKEIYELLTLGQSIIFVRTRRDAQNLTERLRDEDHTVSVLYGEGMTPEKRDRVIDEFRQGTTRVLVTTNVLSRGVDVPAVTAVINYDLPLDASGKFADPETYLHRIGRTGRFGAKGIAINFVYDEKSIKILSDLEKHYNRKIESIDAVEDLAERILKM